VAHHVKKFREVISTGPKVICANTRNFEPVFEFSLLNNCWTDTCPRRHVH